MTLEKLAKHIDHTLLKQDATWPQIAELCDEAVRYGAASVCIPPSYVAHAAAYLGGRVPVCTVIGFPNGYSTAAVKAAEAADAVKNGADEIDMVINVGDLKSGDEKTVADEIRAVKAACGGKTLKVIIECCLLTENEKRAACRCIAEGGADYVKTSTGFSTGGATVEDVRLLRECVGPDVGVKAAGGIKTPEQAETLIQAGANRIGSSGILKVR